MTIQELKDFFKKSDYSEETKSAINIVLADKTELTPGLFAEVKNILQKELDADFNELGIDLANDPEAQKIEKEYDAELDAIEKELDNDMKFVEKELKDLEEMQKKVSKASDEMEVDKLKQSM
jgi:hypothetical protein